MTNTTHEPWRQDLAAPFRSFRLMAYEEALRHGHTDEVLRELHERLLIEDDPECHMLLEYAIAAVARRVAPVSAGVIVNRGDAHLVSHVAGEFVDRLKSVDAATRLELILSLEASQCAALAPHAPDLLTGETDAAVAAVLVRTFVKHWPTERIDVLTDRLLSPHLGLQIAVLEGLVGLAPQHLVQQLPLFLSSPEPRLRALAVWGLAAVDPDEAVNHLQTMLLGSEPHSKLAAIGNLFLLPFDKIKPVLLQFLAAEHDLELVEEAGALVAMNPDLEMPFTLSTMVEQAWPEKTVVLERLVDAACDAIEAAGLTGTDHSGYLARLASFRERRGATLFVQDWLARLDTADTDVVVELVSLMRVCVGGEPVRLALREARLWNLTVRARQVLDQVLAAGPLIDVVPPLRVPTLVPGMSESPGLAPASLPVDPAHPAEYDDILDESVTDMPALVPPLAAPERPAPVPVLRATTAAPVVVEAAAPPPTTVAQAKARQVTAAATSGGVARGAVASPPDPSPAVVERDVPWTDLSLTGRIQRIASWQRADAVAAKGQLTEILRDRDSPVALRATALRAALRLELAGFALAAESGLRSSSANLITAALEYLARFGTDVIVPVLGKFLNAPDLRVRATALQVLRHFDASQALSTVRALLQSQNEEHRRSALACMVQFDWVLVREPLCDFLATNPPTALRDEALGLFEVNPDVANLYPLYRLEQLLGGDGRDAIISTRGRCRDQSAEIGLVTREQLATLEQEFARKWAEEQARRQAPAPYSKRALADRAGRGADDRTKNPSGIAWFFGALRHAFVTAPLRSGALVLAVVGLLMLSWHLLHDDESTRGPRPGPVSGASETKVDGRIEAATAEMLTVRTREGNVVHIQGDKGWTRGYVVGDHIVGWVLPISIDGDGATVARSVMIRKRD